ncbi:prolyl aminopeptidase [Beggiatoa leptomitoformis]|uniref:Proline iminopeptidase n=1 Tax=Beggiatoa leptomitoformis TaxID=288004 RepID=A0A2N9YEB8_9GAMM|nr:prolyl aminopeptidase [Beggiatoa leptomitoformis]ALG68845.1 prolyl aminopeptidase [Beggiatoa leptomitoformis]AUI68786.1 prolyl aminopeptidase [Beggiatoa leptomitoformis]
MRDLYPPIEPYQTGRLAVSDLHTLYYEEVGNPAGVPIVFLHGGPGGGIEPIYRRFFDPSRWRIILFDQRGSGKSTPHAELRENTTWDLVADIERLREHLHIERWTIFGGSWGSTLALAYSQTHAIRCTGLILRGIFMVRKKELDWFYQAGGAHYIFPDAWEKFIALIPPEEQHDMILAYHKRLTSTDLQVRITAAKAWSVWEATTSKLHQDVSLIKRFIEDHFADAFARIENHYFLNQGFLSPDQLLQNVHKIRHLPSVIVQGRYDMICPMISAWELHREWQEAEFVVVPDAGHSMTELGIQSALIEATDRFARCQWELNR